MKIKIIVLIILSVILSFLIYNHTYQKNISIISINSLLKKENYNYEISRLLSESDLRYKYNIDFSNENMKIENLLSIIDNNENNIHELLHNSDVILISIGNNDYKSESLNTIVKDLERLFKKVRTINNKQIYYISPSNIKNTSIIKNLCHNNNIIFLNSSSFKNNNKLLAQFIFRKIKITYEK